MNYEQRSNNRNTGSTGVPGADVWFAVLDGNNRAGIKMTDKEKYFRLIVNEHVLDTDRPFSGFRGGKQPPPEVKQKIKEALNYLFGKGNIMDHKEFLRKISIISIMKGEGITMPPSKTYHLTKEQYRYKVDHMLLDIWINEATHKLMDQFHDRHHDQPSLLELLRLEDEARQLKDNYFILLNEYQEMCNSTKGDEE